MYRVRFYIDNTYEVYETDDLGEEVMFSSCFTGTLSDCEAWIRLREAGRI